MFEESGPSKPGERRHLAEGRGRRCVEGEGRCGGERGYPGPDRDAFVRESDYKERELVGELVHGDDELRSREAQICSPTQIRFGLEVTFDERDGHGNPFAPHKGGG